MKKLKLSFLAVSALTSIGTAFAFSPMTMSNATTYYAIESGGSFFWTTTRPPIGRNEMSCQKTSMNVICTIQTTNVPIPGQVPAGHTSTNQVYKY